MARRGSLAKSARSHYLTAGAHTEGVHAPLADVLGELVFAPGQRRMPGSLVVQAFFDLALQVLSAEAHAEGLAFQHKAAVHQHAEGIPCRVPHRKHQRLAGKAAVCSSDAHKSSVFSLQPGERGVEVHLSAQRLDLLADGCDDAAQQVGAHMGLLLPCDLCRGTVLQKHLGDKITQFIPDAGGQLAIREGACAALAELDVGVGVQLTGGRKVLHRLHTGIQRRAALQHDGAVALPCQQQGRKQSCRAQSAHHRAVRKRLRTRVQGKVCPAVQGSVRTAGRKRSFLPLRYIPAWAGRGGHPPKALPRQCVLPCCGAPAGCAVPFQMPAALRQRGADGCCEPESFVMFSFKFSCFQCGTAAHSCPVQRSCRWRAHTAGRQCSVGR